MRDLKNKLTSSKNTKNIQARKGKSFGYQVLGFGAGGGPIFEYIVATGGTIATSGDYKIHTFTGPGTFTVCAVGCACGSTTITAAIVAGGAGAGSFYGGGGGGGGLVLDSDGFSVSATGYPIVIGGGGNGPTGNYSPGTNGNNSTALGFTTIGGGHGGGGSGGSEAGGSGGGGGGCAPGTVTGTQPSQSNPGATNYGNPGGPGIRGSGGGGAGGAGTTGGSGPGGVGLDVSPTVGPAPNIPNSGVYSRGGGGQGAGQGAGAIGAANTGNGGSGDNFGSGRGAGGSGVVVIKYKFQ
jgi:hypothetical protein